MTRKKMKRKYAFSCACGDYLSSECKKVYRTTNLQPTAVSIVSKKKKNKKNSERELHRGGCDGVRRSICGICILYLVYDIDRNVVAFVVGEGGERTRRLWYDLITYMEATGWLWWAVEGLEVIV